MNLPSACRFTDVYDAWMEDRYGAVDVHYPETGGARAALVIAPDRR